MKYTLDKPKGATCRELEKRLGLNPGDIREIITYPDGTVEIEVSGAIAVSLEDEVKTLAKADQLIDAITNLAEARVFLKRLCARLIRKGLLP